MPKDVLNQGQFRQTISEAVTERANHVLPCSFGDVWQSSNFLVFFPNDLRFEQPCDVDTVDWEGIAKINGNCVVKLWNDESIPVDPTPLIASTLVSPIFINPDSTKLYSFQLALKLNIWRDLVDVQSNYLIPTLSGDLEHAYLLKTQRD